MPGPIIYVDRSEVAQGQLAELKRRINELATFVQRHEPRLLAYDAYFDEPGGLMTVIHVHPDDPRPSRLGIARIPLRDSRPGLRRVQGAAPDGIDRRLRPTRR